MPQVSAHSEKEAREAWRTAPLEALVLHIVERSHMATRLELARLESLAEEAAFLHGHLQPGLVEIRDEVARLGHEMRAHMRFEERETFPGILSRTRGDLPGLPPELLEPMKEILMDEHEAEAGLVRHIRTLLELLTPFDDARGLKGNLQNAFRILSEDLQQHLFLENQILYQRAL